MELNLPIKNKEQDRPSIQTQQLTELVCPVCYEYMHPPIMLCERGHSICELCHELMTECPLCQGRLTFRRSSTLEALTAVTRFPCKYCNKRYRLEELDEHNCFQGPEGDHSPTATCIVGQVYGECTWSGPATDMLSHLSRQHPQQFWTSHENTATWKCTELSSVGVQNVFIVDLNSVTFVIVQKFISNMDVLCWNLSCECENNEQYDYEIRLISADDSETLVQRTQVENAFNILTFFPSSNEIAVGIDKITTFLNSDNILKYKVVIKKRCDFSNQNEIQMVQKQSSQATRFTEEDSNDKEQASCMRKAWSSVLVFYNSVKKLLHLK